MNRKEIKQLAHERMSGNYGLAILAMILLFLVGIGATTFGFFIGAVIVAGAVICCMKMFYLDMARKEAKGVDSIYRGFNRLFQSLKVYLWLLLFAFAFVMAVTILMVLVAMLFAKIESDFLMLIIFAIIIIGSIVAGIILYCRLSLSFYVLCDSDSSVRALDCIKESVRITKGKVLKLIVFELSFILWNIGVMFTLGALSLYVQPYYETAKAILYRDVAGKSQDSEVVEEVAAETV